MPQVSIRAYLPIWTFLYVLQFLLMPLIAQDYWVSNLFGNTMYLMALCYYFVITFLGYNGTSLNPTVGHFVTLAADLLHKRSPSSRVPKFSSPPFRS